MKLANSSTTAVSLVEASLKRIEETKDWHIFTFVDKDAALKKAKEIDERIKNGESVGRLAGVPYALKANFLSKGRPADASAKILTEFISPINSTTAEKLDREGAICVGCVNLDAFAHGSSTENSYYGPTKNSADKTRVAGGSSGGSAVAVALDCVQFATGSDTGGSIRQPATFNGIYGIKPTYGTISRYGVVAMASSFDVIGFLAKSASDLDLLMSITAGQDPKDQTSLPDYYGTNDTKLDKKSVGYIKEFMESPALDPEIKSALESKLSALKAKGYDIIELSMPTLEYALPTYYIIQPAEVASNLSRYDGIRYGFRFEKLQSSDKTPLDLLYENTRNEGFMRENKRRIMIGNFVLSSGFYDAYFLKAAKARTLIIDEFNKAFERVDAILSPASPNPAFKLGEKVDDPVAMYLEDVMSVTANLAGIPAVAFPAGTNKAGLPLGLQIMGPRRSDKNLIKLVEEFA